MLHNFFVSGYRNFKRHKLSTALNLGNLVIGFTVFTLLSLLVNYELNYDKQHKNHERIYRVQVCQRDSEPFNYCTYSPPALRYHTLENLPEVETVLLMKEMSGEYFSLPDGSQLYDKKGYWCENSLFDIFSIHLLDGTETSALTEPNSIVISETLRKKLFPQGNAVGKQVLIGKRLTLTVSGVYTDFPANSTLQASFFVSMSTYLSMGGKERVTNDWTSINCDNFVLLKEGANPTSIDSKIHDVFQPVAGFEKTSPFLQPLSKLHVSPNNQNDLMVGLSILSAAAVLILVLSCLNYVNLSMANSTLRAKEIGIKKVIGSSKRMLVVQFLSETLMMTFLAMFIGVLLAQLFSPVMNLLASNPITVNIFKETRLLAIIFIASLVAGTVSGLYPALVISSYNPVKALKGKLLQSRASSVSLKKVLVVSQFAITLFILATSFLMRSHVRYLAHKDLGFKNNDILFAEVELNGQVPFETIRNRLLHHPEIVDATFSSTIPFVGNIGGYISWEGAQPDEKVMLSRNYVNYDFVNTYNLSVVQGRDFSRDYPSDFQSCLINQTALKAFGWDNAVGKRVQLYDQTYTVIGVVNDFHPFSVHNPIPTYVMFLRDNTLKGHSFITIRCASGNLAKARQIVNAELNAVIPNEAYEFYDFGVAFNIDLAIQFWRSMERIFVFFGIASILVSAMGLLGLMIFSTQRRTKEIGIRKILGSTVAGLYRQLTSEVLGLLAVAVLFAFPLVVLVHRVMPGAYKEALSAAEFLWTLGIVTVISILTISYHVIKVSVRNPVETLRYE
ncbi:MAG: ABC transporter permease [Breznakibacter sp.]